MALGAVFLPTALLSFAFSLLLAGLLGAYYGKGRSRSIGVLLAVVALLLGGLFCALTWTVIPGLDPVFDPTTVGRAMVAVLAAMLGTVVAVMVFVGAVMRS